MQTDYQTLWNKCLAVIKDIVPKAAFDTWFVPIVPLSYEDKKFTIQVPSQFFYEYLEEVEERAEWFRAPSRMLTVLPLENDSYCTPVADVSLEALKSDTRNHSGLLLDTPDRTCLLGLSAIKSLKGRARIEGKALAELDKEILADILNECLKVSKGKALIRFCEGKVRAVLSGDEKDYSIMSMPEIYMVAGAYLYGDFEKARFHMACADHSSVSAIWQLQDKRLTQAYQELLKRYGKTFQGDLVASVRITTSDVGNSGANIFYTISLDGVNLILGETLKVHHKNCKGIEDFTSNMESIFDYYKEALRGVMRLCDIWVSYPANAMIGAMKQAGFGKKLIAETVESFRAAAGENPCSAYEIYCGICEAISIARQQGTNEKGLLALEEKAAMCVSKRWHDLDIPGEIKY